jgi:hypothetical protein
MRFNSAVDVIGHLCITEHALRVQARRGFDAAATSVALSNNRQLLLDKLTALDTSCRRLRHLLIAQRDKHIEQLQIQRHRQELMDQVKNLELACEVSDKTLSLLNLTLKQLNFNETYYGHLRLFALFSVVRLLQRCCKVSSGISHKTECRFAGTDAFAKLLLDVTYTSVVCLPHSFLILVCLFLSGRQKRIG